METIVKACIRVCVLAAWSVSVAAAQVAPGAVPEQAEPPTEAQVIREAHPVFRLLGDYNQPAGERAREVAVIAGSATIAGEVEGDLVVVLGTLRLSSTAIIGGDLVVVGGSAVVEQGAVARHDLVVVGGALESPAGFMPQGEQVVIGPAAAGNGLRALVPWVTHGLLWGRPVVPGLSWIWVVLGVVLLVYLALNVVFERPVGACVRALAEKPLTAFLAGLLVLLLTGPVSFVLVVSVVGLAVVPFLLSALFIAGTFGRIAVARWIGSSIFPHASTESRWQPTRSMIVGFTAITLAYMVPLLGFVAWSTIGVFGLGSAALAVFGGFRRENPVRPAPQPMAAPVQPYSLPQHQTPAAPQSGPDIGGADLTLFPRAPFFDRAAAFVLDLLLVLLTYALLDLHGGGRIFLLLLAYHILFWSWKGTTVGGIICQLRVVRSDGTPLRFVDSVVRGLSSIFSFAVLGLGCFWILKDPDRQAWHDKIAGTYVVKVPRNWPVP
jgi:uncharacterized RDD family membrane protein YckC